jgi:hypothetical protein
VTEADAVGILLRDPYARIVGKDPQLIKADLATGYRAALDALDDPDSVIRIDDLLSNLEVHTDLSFLSSGLGGGAQMKWEHGEFPETSVYQRTDEAGKPVS